MEIQPLDLNVLLPRMAFFLMFLVPLIGMTIRLSVKPMVDALTRLRVASPPGREVELLAARVHELEERLSAQTGSDPFRLGLTAGKDSPHTQRDPS